MARESLVWCVLLTVNLMAMLLQVSPLGTQAFSFQLGEEENQDACLRVRAGHFGLCKHVRSQRSYLQGVEQLESWIGKLLFPNHHHHIN